MKHTRAVPAPEPLPCRREDPELWFSHDAGDVDQAKAHCLACPIRSACLAGALERSEPWGVWGGEWLYRGRIVAGRRHIAATLAPAPARPCELEACGKPIPETLRKDARFCSGACRQAHNRGRLAAQRAARRAAKAGDGYGLPAVAVA